MQTQTTSPQSSNRRSFLVTLLAVAVLSIAGWNLLRLVLTITQWQFFADYEDLSPLYLALSGLFWFILAIGIGLGLWYGRTWSVWAVRLFSLGYTLYFWADRLLLHRSPMQDNWFFPALLTLLSLAFTFWTTRRALSSPPPSTS